MGCSALMKILLQSAQGRRETALLLCYGKCYAAYLLVYIGPRHRTVMLQLIITSWSQLQQT